MVTLVLDPEVEHALRREALVQDRSVDEIASMMLSSLLLEE
jgi:hypothetical protein